MKHDLVVFGLLFCMYLGLGLDPEPTTYTDMHPMVCLSHHMRCYAACATFFFDQKISYDEGCVL